MDYKFIILLVVLLGLILFFTKELNNIRNDSDEKINRVIACVDNNSKLIRGNFKSELDGCVTKMKAINRDFMAQVRRMDSYESQPITVASNRFDDDDSNDKKHNAIPYLSEAYEHNKQVKNDKDKNKESFYMSEDVPNISDKRAPKIQSQSAGQFKVSYAENDKDQIAEKKSLTSSHSSKSLNSKKSNHGDLDDNTSSESDSDSSSSQQTTSSSKKSSMSSSSVKKSDSDSNDDSSALSIEVDQDVIKKTKAQVPKKSITKSKQKNKKDVSVSNSSSSSGTVHSSKYGSITLGSKKDKGVKLSKKIELKSKKKDESSSGNSGSENSDGESINTNNMNISSLTIDELKPITNYTSEYLKKVAKRFSIPLTLKDGNARRQLRKEELYDKIKANLIEKENK